MNLQVALVVWVCCFTSLSTAMDMLRGPVNLTIHFPGQAQLDLSVNQYFVRIPSLVTDTNHS